MAAVAPNNAKVSSGQGVVVGKISPAVALSFINKGKSFPRSVLHDFPFHLIRQS